MTIAAILVAAGRGLRAGGGLPKQWRRLGQATIADRAIEAFRSHPAIGPVILVVHPEDRVAGLVPDIAGIEIVEGGATRGASVQAGLEAALGRASHVLIHDAARPLVPRAVIDRVIAALGACDGAAPGLPVTDALWRGAGGRVSDAVPRGGLFRAQTPQGFRLAPLLAAHRALTTEAADDVEVALAAGIGVAIVEGAEDNFKITGPEDHARAERLIGEQMDIRLGNGFDVHRFGPGDHVVLCGVRVPFDRGLQGHSDADVGMHALTDAIYGALAEGDIGRHFPPSDPRWRGADSAIFLRHAADLAVGRGYRIASADVTIVCEAPKVGPHAEAMRGRLAEIAGVARDRVSVKATTSERLGFAGRGEGIAALATAALAGA